MKRTFKQKENSCMNNGRQYDLQKFDEFVKDYRGKHKENALP